MALALCLLGSLTLVGAQPAAADPTAANASADHIDIWPGRTTWTYFGFDLIGIEPDTVSAITLDFPVDYPPAKSDGRAATIWTGNGSVGGALNEESTGLVIDRDSVLLIRIQNGFHVEVNLSADANFVGPCESSLGIVIYYSPIQIIGFVDTGVTLQVHATPTKYWPPARGECVVPAAAAPTYPFLSPAAAAAAALAFKGITESVILALRWRKGRT